MPVVKFKQRVWLAGVCGLMLIMALAAGWFLQPPADSRVSFNFDPQWLEQIELKYGVDARQRFALWLHLMETERALPEADKLVRVNDFFNHNLRFVADLVQWLKEDYWATPSEFLAKGGGDCEDFSIAKYFTLAQMGVDENKLRITYVKSVTLNQAHMVLTYFETPQSIPLVLDNIDFNIKPASARTDLVPAYSFNGSGLWLAKLKGGGGKVGSADKLDPWADLKRRMMSRPF